MSDILIIEDNFSTRHNLVNLLEKSGYTVMAAENGENALELIQYETPDLIISDIMMPGMDGFELFDKINGSSIDEHIPFIFLTGKTESSDQRDGMLAGADDYITKPFKALDLLKSVETRLRKKNKIDRKMEKFKSSITRNMSHEFRTPLVPIIGYSQIIKDNCWELDPREIMEMTEKINSSGSWMLKLIEKFLLLVELEENNEKNQDSCTSFRQTALRAVDRITSSSGRKEDIITNISEASVKMPELQLEIIITEILDNSLRFSNPGSPVEIISYSEGNSHFVTITDFGKGMTRDEVRFISSFFQFNRNGMQRAGLGLGLSIVKKIAENNEANVKIESEFGIYTRVGLELPLLINQKTVHPEI